MVGALPIVDLTSENRRAGVPSAGQRGVVPKQRRDHKFFCEVRDMKDGKLAAPLFGEDDSSMSVTVNIEAARKKLFGDDE